ncbi:DUF2059 domain-containing protein [Pelomonas sp. BJYL3]|uniref:DUF2059 domain-containing protein n=1 Tax=Pelomonas sp. BJYL3 TaxID=2976697 RepID=UPI0022B3B30B|nr:DUF2059 domain-containing protein [Pelomonas sp. BJYL3]
MKNLFKTTLAIATLGFSSLGFAADSAPVEAARLLDTLNLQRVLQESIETSLDAQIQRQPKLVPYRAVMLTFMAKYMSYEGLKDELVDIYAKEFTGEELAALREFYQTPVGRKAIERLPALMGQGMQMGQRRVQAHLGELEDMIKAETERLQSQQQSQQPAQQPKKAK